MVFVKVRETYDLHTIRNKMSVIGIHTPKSQIIKDNFPGLLMQCKAYRPVACSVKMACASMQSSDPLQVGTTEGEIAPEDLFNPILYKTITNVGMSQLEARITALSQTGTGVTANGQTAVVESDGFTNFEDEFLIYYGLLQNAHGWRTANPQAGLSMEGIVPLVHEMLYSFGDGNPAAVATPAGPLSYPNADGTAGLLQPVTFRGNAKPVPFMNCTAYSSGEADAGFPSGTSGTANPKNHQLDVPAPNIACAVIVIPPSRLHELYYRMIVEWTLEFTGIRPMSEVVDWVGLQTLGSKSYYRDYDFSAQSKALLGHDSEMIPNEQSMASANVDLNKVM